MWKKTMWSFFRKLNIKEDISLVLRKIIKVNQHTISRSEWIKFIVVFLEKHLSCKEHKKYTENEITENVGIIFKAKLFLNEKCLLLLLSIIITLTVT